MANNNIYIQKIADEGTSEPYYARLWLGIFNLRDEILQTKLWLPKKVTPKYRFDSAYNSVLNALNTTRNAAKNIQQLLSDHKEKIFQKRIIQYKQGQIFVSESIYQELSSNLTTFITQGVVAIKDTQNVLKQFNIDIGCLFGKESKFKNGILKLQTEGHANLAKFLNDVRHTWSEQFIKRRIDIEHNSWVMPRLKYKKTGKQKVKVVEPKIDGNMELVNYSEKMLNRLCSFIENIIVYGFQFVIKQPYIIVEIPKAKRNPLCPLKFDIKLKTMNIKEWVIQYLENDFL